MLLGYIDQLFAANFAYRDTKGLFPEGLLKGKSVVCVSTMKGPTNYPFLWLNNAHKILMKRALFKFVGMKKVKFFEFGNMESKKGKQQQKLNKVYQYFRKVAYYKITRADGVNPLHELKYCRSVLLLKILSIRLACFPQ